MRTSYPMAAILVRYEQYGFRQALSHGIIWVLGKSLDLVSPNWMCWLLPWCPLPLLLSSLLSLQFPSLLLWRTQRESTSLWVNGNQWKRCWSLFLQTPSISLDNSFDISTDLWAGEWAGKVVEPGRIWPPSPQETLPLPVPGILRDQEAAINRAVSITLEEV